MTSDPENSETTLQITIADDPPPRLDKALARDAPEEEGLSRTRLARLIASGQVRRGADILSDPRAKVRAGDVLFLTVPPEIEIEARPEPIPLNIVYEDGDLIVIDKPVGMVVHPAPGSPRGTLVNALLAHCGDSLSGIGGAKRPGIVHRIDKDTSGLIVAAKSDKAHQGLAVQFAEHSVTREYRALVYGSLEASDPRLQGLRGVRREADGSLCVTTLLDRHRSDRQKQAVFFDHGRRAVTRAWVLERYGQPPAASLIACRLETGRTHQIRVHMAYVGHGLIGDPIYGSARQLAKKSLGAAAVTAAANYAGQALHAAVLGFTHPITGEKLAFTSDLPPAMDSLLNTLRSSSAHHM
ncbi:MAG: RluA family pseudouridine synthase [Pseudomonadota bacterium]